jgi:hypothetical protein
MPNKLFRVENSTSKSTSLFSVDSPRAIEPNIPTFDTSFCRQISINFCVLNGYLFIFHSITKLYGNPMIIPTGESHCCPTAWRSADWPALQDYLHYNYFTAKEHTNENTKPKANSAAAPGWAALLAFYIHIY